MRRIVWLASFPKSGNTWTRAFLGSYLSPPGQAVSINELSSITTFDARQDWHDLAIGKPFVGKTLDDSLVLRPKIQRMIAASRPGSRFVKTHSKMGRVGEVDLILPEVTAAAIYIMRNPFDVSVSYARHNNLSVDDAIQRMCDPMNLNSTETLIFDCLGRWDEHIQGWTTAPGLARHVMRYEDMVENPKKAFQGLLAFLKVPIDPKKLRHSLKATSFKELQRQERQKGFKEKPKHAKSFFVSGKAGGWKDELTVEQVETLRTEFADTLEKYFPEVAKEADAFIAQENPVQ